MRHQRHGNTRTANVTRTKSRTASRSAISRYHDVQQAPGIQTKGQNTSDRAVVAGGGGGGWLRPVTPHHKLRGGAKPCAQRRHDERGDQRMRRDPSVPVLLRLMLLMRLLAQCMGSVEPIRQHHDGTGTLSPSYIPPFQKIDFFLPGARLTRIATMLTAVFPFAALTYSCKVSCAIRHTTRAPTESGPEYPAARHCTPFRRLCPTLDLVVVHQSRCQGKSSPNQSVGRTTASLRLHAQRACTSTHDDASPLLGRPYRRLFAWWCTQP